MMINFDQSTNVDFRQTTETREVAPVAAVVKEIVNVSKIASLAQISINQPEHTLWLFDIDDTVFDSATMLGSKAWRRYISKAAKEIDPSANWHDKISYDLAKKHPLKAVESDPDAEYTNRTKTSAYIKKVQEKGYPVGGFTSRERKRWYDTEEEGVDALTTNQLKSVEVDFNNKCMENQYPYLALESEYFQGTFFSDEDIKGDYVAKVFGKNPQFKGKVIFIDDKDTQAESVAKALVNLNIEHECYVYTATEEKGKEFKPLIANIELYYFYAENRCLSDAEAAGIAAQNPDKDERYYLKAALEKAKVL